MLLRGTYGDTTPFFFTMTNDVNSFIFGYLIAVQKTSLMLQKIALIDNKVLPQTLSISLFLRGREYVYQYVVGSHSEE